MFPGGKGDECIAILWLASLFPHPSLPICPWLWSAAKPRARYAVAGKPFDLDSETFSAENCPN
jgi:hypothetical protein